MTAAAPLQIGREPVALVVLEVDQEPRVLIGNSVNGESMDEACDRLETWLEGYPDARELLISMLDAQARRRHPTTERKT